MVTKCQRNLKGNPEAENNPNLWGAGMISKVSSPLQSAWNSKKHGPEGRIRDLELLGRWGPILKVSSDLHMHALAQAHITHTHTIQINDT